MKLRPAEILGGPFNQWLVELVQMGDHQSPCLIRFLIFRLVRSRLSGLR